MVYALALRSRPPSGPRGRRQTCEAALYCLPLSGPPSLPGFGLCVCVCGNRGGRERGGEREREREGRGKERVLMAKGTPSLTLAGRKNIMFVNPSLSDTVTAPTLVTHSHFHPVFLLGWILCPYDNKISHDHHMTVT